MPFRGLTSFGGAFLSKFECAQMPHPVSLRLRLIFLSCYLLSTVLFITVPAVDAHAASR